MTAFFARIFLSPDEKRLRAGWRLALQTLLFMLLLIPLIAVFQWADSRGGTGGAFSSRGRFVLGQGVELFSLTASVWIARRYLDRRSFRSLGLEVDFAAWRDLLAGILITGVMMGCLFLLYLLFGWTQTVTYGWQETSAGNLAVELLFWLLFFMAVGWKEELWMRGYVLQNLADGLNVPWAVFLSSAIFGLLHLGNPHATWASALGILVAGIFLALPWVWTRRLWLSIGLHIGWNFFEGVVFGFPVSGQDTFRLIRPVIHGPELWTGGAFGPEAGLVLLPAILLGAALVRLYTQRAAR